MRRRIDEFYSVREPVPVSHDSLHLQLGRVIRQQKIQDHTRSHIDGSGHKEPQSALADITGLPRECHTLAVLDHCHGHRDHHTKTIPTPPLVVVRHLLYLPNRRLLAKKRSVMPTLSHFQNGVNPWNAINLISA